MCALKQNDGEKAKGLAKIENEADALYLEYLDKPLQTKVRSRCVMCNLQFSCCLERITDHTTYVGEAVAYISTGEKMIYDKLLR